jgi:hypothetical protein
MTSITYRKRSPKAKNKGIIGGLRILCTSTLSSRPFRVSKCSRPRYLRGNSQVKAQHHAFWPQGSPSDTCFTIINADAIWLKWHRLALHTQDRNLTVADGGYASCKCTSACDTLSKHPKTNHTRHPTCHDWIKYATSHWGSTQTMILCFVLDMLRTTPHLHHHPQPP